MSARLDNVELLRRLVAFDSASANSNLPIADFISQYLERDGVRILRVPADNEPKTNLVIWLGPDSAEDRQGLVLSGHMDVVPAGERGWDSDPFQLTEREGRWFGRGASDMKGFLALTMNAVASVNPATLRKPLVLIFTYDEEAGTLGAQHLVRRWAADRVLPRSAIIGEPTSLRVVSAHKGHLKIRFLIQGKSAHSGYPHLGRNAIERAGGVISALTKLRLRLAGDRSQNSNRFPETPFATLNIGTIQGGTAVNVVPDRCEMEIGIRLLPGMESEEMIEQIRDMVARVLAPGESRLEIASDSPPMLLREEAPIYRDLCALVSQQSLESVSFASDAGWFQKLGLDCVLFGPGSIEVAHRPNEFMPQNEFVRAAELLPGIIQRFCA